MKKRVLQSIRDVISNTNDTIESVKEAAKFASPCGPEGRIRVTSYYGSRILNGRRQMHNGIDLRSWWEGSPFNALCMAPERLTIISFIDPKRRPNGSYGWADVCAVNDAGDRTWRFGHAKRLRGAKIGDVIEKGQTIAIIDDLYDSASLHLHLDLVPLDRYLHNQRVDPLPILLERGLVEMSLQESTSWRVGG